MSRVVVMVLAIHGVVQGAGVVGGLAQEGMKKKVVDMALDSALHQADKIPKVAAFRTKAEARLARGSVSFRGAWLIFAGGSFVAGRWTSSTCMIAAAQRL